MGRFSSRMSSSRKTTCGEVVLVARLREAIRRLNPAIPEEAREEALRKVLRVGSPSLTRTNRGRRGQAYTMHYAGRMPAVDPVLVRLIPPVVQALETWRRVFFGHWTTAS